MFYVCLIIDIAMAVVAFHLIRDFLGGPQNSRFNTKPESRI